METVPTTSSVDVAEPADGDHDDELEAEDDRKVFRSEELCVEGEEPSGEACQSRREDEEAQFEHGHVDPSAGGRRLAGRDGLECPAGARVHEVGGKQESDGHETPDDRGVRRAPDRVAADLERLGDSDTVLSARKTVLRVEERHHDQVECERGESEVVAAEAKERHADDCCDHGRHNGCDRDGHQRVDAGVDVDEALVGVEPNREEAGRVRADQEERSLSERDLAREAHEQRQPQRDECVQRIRSYDRHGSRKLERDPAGEGGCGQKCREPRPRRQRRRRPVSARRIGVQTASFA